MDAGPTNPPCWAADPLGRHQYRYWDGAQWTEHVADNGMNGIDPPSPAPPGSTSSAPTTTRAVPGRDPTAVLGRRYGAFLIDAAVCVVVFLLLFFPFATARTRAETLRIPDCHPAAQDSSRVECANRFVLQLNDTVYEGNTGVFLALAVLFTFLYFAVAEGLVGASLGKYMTGIRVVGASGNRIGLLRSTARWALFAVDGPLSLFVCGIITSSVSRGHRRLGDLAARSYVVSRDDVGRPVVIP